MSDEEQREWRLTADYLKEEWPEIIIDDTLGFWQVVGMNNSEM